MPTVRRTVADDGTLTLRLRLPDCLAGQHGKHLTMEGVRFATATAGADGFGEQCRIAPGIDGSTARRRLDRSGPGRQLPVQKRDAKGWRVFATTRIMEVVVVTDRRGVIGVDLNADHLAVAETDASGNYLNAWRTPGHLREVGSQAEAIIGDAVAGVVQHGGQEAHRHREAFRRKKATLEGESRRYSRMLSSFGCGKIRAYFLSRGYREGVEVCQVNPAFSSVIGRVKFMERYGLSVHQAAALVLARRLLGCSERIPRRWVAPIGNGVQVAFTVPVRKRVKHVWTYWGAVLGQLRPALAAQHRLGKRRRRPNPVQAVVRTEARGVA